MKNLETLSNEDLLDLLHTKVIEAEKAETGAVGADRDRQVDDVKAELLRRLGTR